MRPLHIAAGLSVVALALACTESLTPPRQTDCNGIEMRDAIVSFAWDTRPDTMRVLVTDPATVAAACTFLAGGRDLAIPSGPIARGSLVDASIPFHYIPDSVRIVDLAMEICDGRLMRTTAQLDEFFRGATGDVASPRAPFCPWGARPVRVVQAPE
jgi:hypothetical protein